MREMEHCIPRAHLSQVISYCFRQLLIPLPAQEFSCNANVMVRPTNGNCKSRKKWSLTWSTAFWSPFTLLPTTCSSSLVSTILLEMDKMACVTGMSCDAGCLATAAAAGGNKTNAAPTSCCIWYKHHTNHNSMPDVTCQYHYCTQHNPSCQYQQRQKVT